jgi:hypothetical protein
MQTIRTHWVVLATLAWVSGQMPPAAALEASVVLGHTAEYTTNTARTESDEVSDWIQRPNIQVGLMQQSTQLDLDAGYRYERRMYREDLFDDEYSLTGAAGLVWHALPERLDFIVRNTRTDATRRSFTPFTEANRQTISITNAGPLLRFRPRQNSELQLEYTYTDVSANRTRSDSQSHTGAMRYVVNLSSIRSIEFAGTRRRVDFDNALAADLNVTTASATINKTGTDLDYSLMGGYNVTKRAHALDDVDGLEFDLLASWNASSVTVVQLAAGHRITERSRYLSGGDELDFGDGVIEDSDLNEVFRESRGAVSVTRPIGNNQVSLSLGAYREKYEDVPRDNERLATRLTLSRNLNPLTTLNASLEAGRRRYTDEDSERNEYRGDLGVTRQVTPRFSASIGGSYEEWDGDGFGRSYEEWIGRISVNYLLFDRR